MAMASDYDLAPLRDTLIAAIAGELARQDARNVDVAALADAIMTAINAPPARDAEEGKRPEDLNATNDD